jgi:putative FmdB family regulatory protein
MPIYEYECKSCGHRLEVIQKISDDPLKDCPQCHKPELKKLISAAGFRLKGGGWYETDFKSGKRKNVIQSESDKGVSGSDNKSDKKSASKPETKNQSGNKSSQASATAGSK